MDSQVAELSKRVAQLEKRVAQLEGGGSSPAKRPASAASRKDSTASNGAAESGDAVKKSPSKSSVKSGASAKVPSAAGRSSSDFKAEAVDPDLQGSYFVGKRKVGYLLPDSMKGVAPSPAPPRASLQLEYIHGYNGKSCKQNLRFVEGDKHHSFVYCVAATGVVHDPVSKSQRYFHGHNEDIVSFAAHPSRAVIATGQTDPKGKGKPYVCLWDYEGKEPTEIGRLDEFHDRGICAIAFGPDKNKLIATVGMDDSHTLAIWDVPSGGKTVKKPKMSANASKAEVFDAAFSPTSDFQLITVGAGAIKVWTLEDGRLKDKSVSVMGKSKEVEKNFLSVKYLDDGRAVVGGESGRVYVLDTSGTLAKVLDAHKGHVGAVVPLPDGGFATAGLDGLATWSSDLSETGRVEFKSRPTALDVSKDGKALLVGTASNSVFYLPQGVKGKSEEVIVGHSSEVWALAVHPSTTVFATGAKNVKFWDTKKKESVALFNLPASKKKDDSAVAMAFSPDGSALAIGTANGRLLVVTYPKLDVVLDKALCKEQIAAVNYSPNGQLIGVGSWDQTVVLVENGGEFKSVVLKGHTSSVTHLTFSTDSKFVASNSRDYEILYWNCESGKREKGPTVRNIEWHDWQNVLGWPVRAVFKSGMDGTDVNACNISKDGSLVAAVTDFGTVELYAQPALHEKAESKTSIGHSSHVTNCRFTAGDDYLITTGGLDFGVFQWSVRK